MKSCYALKTRLLILTTVGLLTIHGFANANELSNTKPRDYENTLNNDGDITVTIDKNTSENNFKDIKTTLAEYGINAEFSNTKRNDANELTGIKIRLFDANNSTTAGFSSSMPLSQVSFGRKNGTLYISQGKIGAGNATNMQAFGFNQDAMSSISDMLNGLNLNDFFSDENGAFSFNGQDFNLNELQKQLQDQFGSDAFWSLFGNLNPGNKPFYFVDDPDTERIIIIDGKESNFDTLNELAKNNSIEAIDYLKPKTAVSLYGNKAKDGAIIVTTK